MNLSDSTNVSYSSILLKTLGETRRTLLNLIQKIPAPFVLRFLNRLTFRNFFGVNRIWHENAPFGYLPTQQGLISCNTYPRIFAQ